jgi:predicted nucleotidyltransferase
MTEITTPDVDPVTANAAKVFLQRIAHQFAFEQAILFGSRARHTHRPDSDADIVVIMSAAHGDRADAVVAMAGIAFDVLLDTGVLVQALPLWRDEFEHPEDFNNPALIANIHREGVRL